LNFRARIRTLIRSVTCRHSTFTILIVHSGLFRLQRRHDLHGHFSDERPSHHIDTHQRFQKARKNLSQDILPAPLAPTRSRGYGDVDSDGGNFLLIPARLQSSSTRAYSRVLYTTGIISIIRPVGVTLLLAAHTWSLSIEEQFYVLWPIVIGFLLSRFGKTTASNPVLQLEWTDLAIQLHLLPNIAAEAARRTCPNEIVVRSTGLTTA
jgi:hypothetical protein